MNLSCSKDSDLFVDVVLEDAVDLEEVTPGSNDQQNSSDNTSNSDPNSQTGGDPESGNTSGQNSNTSRSFDLNVMDFGATGDGITDDRAAIQSAIDAASEISGVLYFPSGTYLLDKKPNAQDGERLDLRDNVTIIGDGDSSVLTITPDPVKRYGYILRASYVDNWSISNMNFDGNKDNVAGDDQIGVASMLIDNCTNFNFVDNLGGHSMYVNIIVRGSTDGDISNNRFLDADCGIIGVSGGTGSILNRDIRMENNFIDGHDWSEGIVFYGGSSDNLLIRNNTIRNKRRGHGIAFGRESQPNARHSNIIITDNTISNMSSGIGLLFGEYSNITIARNDVHGIYEGIGIWNGGDNIVITDNTVAGDGQDGIAITNATNVVFKNNTVTSYLWECIDIKNTTFLENSGNSCP